jgi:hypothetical protein
VLARQSEFMEGGHLAVEVELTWRRPGQAEAPPPIAHAAIPDALPVAGSVAASSGAPEASSSAPMDLSATAVVDG